MFWSLLKCFVDRCDFHKCPTRPCSFVFLELNVPNSVTIQILYLFDINSVALSPRANYTDWATATCRRNLVSTFVDRGVSRGQRSRSPTASSIYLYNIVALSPRANYTDWATATCRRNLVSTFVDSGVSRGQRGGSPTAFSIYLYNISNRKCFNIMEWIFLIISPFLKI
jgi:hypothetical protein